MSAPQIAVASDFPYRAQNMKYREYAAIVNTMPAGSERSSRSTTSARSMCSWTVDNTPPGDGEDPYYLMNAATVTPNQR